MLLPPVQRVFEHGSCLAADMQQQQRRHDRRRVSVRVGGGRVVRGKLGELAVHWLRDITRSTIAQAAERTTRW